MHDTDSDKICNVNGYQELTKERGLSCFLFLNGVHRRHCMSELGVGIVRSAVSGTENVMSLVFKMQRLNVFCEPEPKF